MASFVVGVTILMIVAIVSGGYLFQSFGTITEEIDIVSQSSKLAEQIQEYSELNYNLDSEKYSIYP